MAKTDVIIGVNGNPLDSLRDKLKAQWDELYSTSRWIKGILGGNFDRRLFAIYLIQTYHYTKHNSRNQALVATRDDSMSTKYRKFCAQHAEEETGHELMALHDLKSIGVSIEDDQLPDPMNSTETLIAYLYWVSAHGNPLRRLGYSFWAESVYGYIGPVLSEVRERLELENKNLTFLTAHAEIDAVHAKEIDNMLELNCSGPEDWAGVERVMRTSLYLTGEMLDEVYDAYQKTVDGESGEYDCLRNLG